MKFHLSEASKNSKIGLISSTTTSWESCPDSCPLKLKGCYTYGGPLALHARKVTEGSRGDEWEDFILKMRALPRGRKVRYNQSGDLPGFNESIDIEKLEELTKVVKERNLQVWTYSHKWKSLKNIKAIKRANEEGLIINLSANSLDDVDRLQKHKIPIAVVVPSDSPNTLYTKNGVKIVICPAQRENKNKDGGKITCEMCMLCYQGKRSCAVGFKSHGISTKHVDKLVSNN